MNATKNNVELVDDFAALARRFCSVVDSAASLERADFLARIYPLLPRLIGEAIGMPDVELSDTDKRVEGNTPSSENSRQAQPEWEQLYNLLKEKLGGWDLYRQVFDPTQDSEAIVGSLADDIADIYLDLKKGLFLDERHVAPEDIIWEWRLLFHSHWGKHAMDALLTIHALLQNNTA
jgi:hypothetical protein